MKRFFSIVTFIIVCLSCEKDNNNNNNNPYLPNYSFEINLNMSFPQYSSLQYPSNAVYVNAAGVGVRGIIVFNAGSSYVAFDAACPNQPLSDCSTMIISGVNAKCPCDDAMYSLFTGLASGKEYPMKMYRVQMVDANTIKVFN